MKIKEITDEWVAMFSDPGARVGVTWELSKLGSLPEGVDEDDPRVKAILELS